MDENFKKNMKFFFKWIKDESDINLNQKFTRKKKQEEKIE